MNRIGEALKAIEADLKMAEEQRTKIRKRVDAGVSHKSHLAYAEMTSCRIGVGRSVGS